MRRTTKSYGLALLLAIPMSAGAEVSWLDAEVRAQEARWAAQQGNAAPLGLAATSALPGPPRPGPARPGARRRGNKP